MTFPAASALVWASSSRHWTRSSTPSARGAAISPSVKAKPARAPNSRGAPKLAHRSNLAEGVLELSYCNMYYKIFLNLLLYIKKEKYFSFSGTVQSTQEKHAVPRDRPGMACQSVTETSSIGYSAVVNVARVCALATRRQRDALGADPPDRMRCQPRYGGAARSGGRPPHQSQSFGVGITTPSEPNQSTLPA